MRTSASSAGGGTAAAPSGPAAPAAPLEEGTEEANASASAAVEEVEGDSVRSLSRTLSSSVELSACEAAALPIADDSKSRGPRRLVPSATWPLGSCTPSQSERTQPRRTSGCMRMRTPSKPTPCVWKQWSRTAELLSGRALMGAMMGALGPPTPPPPPPPPPPPRLRVLLVLVLLMLVPSGASASEKSPAKSPTESPAPCSSAAVGAAAAVPP